MGDMLKLIRWAVIGLFRSRVSLEAKFSFSPNATRRLLRKLLRHQGFKDRIEGSAKRTSEIKLANVTPNAQTSQPVTEGPNERTEKRISSG
jgi:hypothetical protein